MLTSGKADVLTLWTLAVSGQIIGLVRNKGRRKKTAQGESENTSQFRSAKTVHARAASHEGLGEGRWAGARTHLPMKS